MAGFFDWLTPQAVRPDAVPSFLLSRPGPPMNVGPTESGFETTPEAPAGNILEVLRSLFSQGQAAAAPTPASPGMPLPGVVPENPISQLQNWITAPGGTSLLDAAKTVVNPAALATAALPLVMPKPAAPMTPTPGTSPQFTWPGDTSSKPASFTVGGGDDITRSLIKKREGLIDTAKYDVNAFRVGYGSDTITDPVTKTVRPVKEGDKITPEMAEADLTRRIPEFQAKIISQVGSDVWTGLNPNVKAALTSVAYNYGNLPEGVAAAAKTGDPTAIAAAISHPTLLGHNEGINAERRLDEARVALGGAPGLPGIAKVTAPQLPAPPTIEALRGLDPAAYDKFDALRVMMAPPLTTGDRITNVLANMAAGARGAKTAADVILGAGAGAGKGATENISQTRADLQRGADRSGALQQLQAGIAVDKARAGQQGANYGVEARNETARLQNLVAQDQAKLDAAAKNKMAEAQFDLDLKKYELFQPQYKITGDGLAIVTRKPEGGMQFDTVKMNDIHETAKKVKDAAAAYGKDNPMVEALVGDALGNQPGGTEKVKMYLLSKLVQQGWGANVFGEDNYKKLRTEAEKGIPAELRQKPENWNAEVNKKIEGLLLEKIGRKEIPDSLWIPFMAKKGDPLALKLTPRG